MPLDDLLDRDALAPAPTTSWQDHGAWHFLETPTGSAVVYDESGVTRGCIRYADGMVYNIPVGTKDIFQRAVSLLVEGPPVWSRLDDDPLQPETVEVAPAPSPSGPLADLGERTPPARTAYRPPLPWDFK